MLGLQQQLRERRRKSSPRRREMPATQIKIHCDLIFFFKRNNQTKDRLRQKTEIRKTYRITTFDISRISEQQCS